MTRGGVSKITAKRRGKGLILSERIPDNQKEVYYRLTGDGEKLFALHAKLHDIAYKNITRVVAEYGEDEMIIIRGFLKKVISAVGALSWENLKVLRDL
jgi:DNA-binding MarR family transcriptional regulator